MNGNIPLLYKVNTGKNNVIEYVEHEIYELPDSDYIKSAARVFDEIYNGKAGVLPKSKFLTLLKHLGRFSR